MKGRGGRSEGVEGKWGEGGGVIELTGAKISVSMGAESNRFESFS